MSLREYTRKRHFDRTPEPKAIQVAKKGWSYVIQKHRATHLHYDFRLELDGVLKSWAVPKGPSLDPSVKRLAMHVEDHPVDYGSFEGIIPQGEYGGGTVMLWDRGYWEPVGDPEESYRAGRLKFILHGKKLKGAWMLVRTGGRDADKDERRWLLFKERDDEAQPESEGDILHEKPLSVTTRRDLDEIAGDQDRVWSSNGASNGKTKRQPARSASRGVRQPAAKPKQNGRVPVTVKSSRRAEIELAGVRLTHPDKVLYPEQAVTKLELAEYFMSVAKWMLPSIEDRPLVLVRCPEGREKACFYQKHPGAGTPGALRQVPIREQNQTKPYVLVDNVAGLVALAQVGALEIHAWGSRIDKLEQPDRLVFDLDPGPGLAWGQVVQSALQVREFLEELGLVSFVKTTGGKGLHLVVPIQRSVDWDEAKAFCKRVADLIVTADPKRYTAKMTKAVRPGKIFIDYLRNGRGATSVVPYSTRSRPNAPISVPLAWEELTEKITPDYFTVRNISKRLKSLKRDPWAKIASVRQTLTAAIKKVNQLP